MTKYHGYQPLTVYLFPITIITTTRYVCRGQLAYTVDSAHGDATEPAEEEGARVGLTAVGDTRT